MKNCLIVLFLLGFVGKSFAADCHWKAEEFYARLNIKTLENFLKDVNGDLQALKPNQRNELVDHFEKNLKKIKLIFVGYYQRFYSEEDERYIKDNATYLIAKMLQESSFNPDSVPEFELLEEASRPNYTHLNELAHPLYGGLSVIPAQWASFHVEASLDYRMVLVISAFMGTWIFCALLVDCVERCMRGPSCGFSIKDAKRILDHVKATHRERPNSLLLQAIKKGK